MADQTLKVAMLQLAAPPDAAAAWAKGEQWCRAARDRGADIALFPEMWSIGYRFPDPACPAAVEAWRERAVSADGPEISKYRTLARDLGMAIGITYLEASEGGPRNTISLLDRNGEIALHYAKVHTCDFAVESLLTPGDGFRCAELDTAAGPVTVGAMICYDREFPESARLLMLQGAELVLVPNACTWDHNRARQLHSRAFENMFAIAMANYASTGENGNGHSTALDGIAYEGPDLDRAAREMTLVEAPDAEGIYMASFDLAALRAYRSRETWGDAFRKPRAYGALTHLEPTPPFVRPCSRR